MSDASLPFIPPAKPIVGDDDRVVGIVSQADLLAKVAATGPTGARPPRRRGTAKGAATSARELMSAPALSIAPVAPLSTAARKMQAKKVKRLLVTGGSGQLLGIVSRADLLRAVLEPPARIGEGAQERDARIRAALRKEMREQKWAGSLYTFADVKDGVVTLHGFVRSDAIRRGLRVLAERVDGVERVEDRMEEAPRPLPGEFV